MQLIPTSVALVACHGDLGDVQRDGPGDYWVSNLQGFICTCALLTITQGANDATTSTQKP